MNTKSLATAVMAMLTALSSATAQAQMSSAFTYQGYLEESGEPVTGGYQCTFALYDAEAGGTYLGQDIDTVTFENGYFTAHLDYADGLFTGDPRWLEITVDTTTLSPRHEITPTPYALTAQTLVVPVELTSDAISTLDLIGTGPTGNVLDVQADNVEGTGLSALRATHVPSGNNVKLGMPAAGVYSRVQTGSAVIAEHLSTGNASWLGTANYGVYGLAPAPSDWAGYFEGNAYFSDNVGIGTDTPSEMLSVDGAIESLTGGFKFPDGTTQTTASTGGGSSLWSENGSDIYYDSGNVGIGITTPTAPLEVRSTLPNPSIVTAGGNDYATWAGQYMSFGHWDGSTYVARLGIDDNGDTALVPNGGNVGIGTSNPGADVEVWTDDETQLLLGGATGTGANDQGYKLRITSYDNDDANYTYPIYVMDENSKVDFWLRSRSNTNGDSTAYFQGNVGIGTAEPEARLHVGGAGQQILIGDAHDAAEPALKLWGGHSSGYAYIQAGGEGGAPANLRITKYNTGFDPLDELQISAVKSHFSGNLGIGTADPEEKLHVAGKARCEQLQVTDSVTAGHVLTADANGNASWQPPGAFTLPYSGSCSSSTAMSVTSTDGTGIHGYGTVSGLYDSAAGVWGQATGGNLAYSYGVRGTASASGPLDSWNYGVFGEVPADSTGTCYGVYGKAAQLGDVGVYGENTVAGGVGVYGDGTATGVGGHFEGQENDGSSAALEVESGSDLMLIDGDEISCTSEFLHIQNNGGYLYLGENGGRVTVGATGEATSARLKVLGGTDASLAGGGFCVLGDTTGANVCYDNNEIVARNNGAAASLSLNSGSGDVVLCYNGGDVAIGHNNPTAPLDVHGNIVVRDDDGIIVEIGHGLDYSEGFNVLNADEVTAGSVLVIDPAHPGELQLSTEAYDHKVAGVVAGANGLGSGVKLGSGQFDHDVALAGRVYCKVDATYGEVQPGDLLTTSATPGHAMRVADTSKAQGAILGKAMEPLEAGQRGEILVLVTLQ